MGVAADRGRDQARHSGQRTEVRRRLRGRQCGPPTQYQFEAIIVGIVKVFDDSTAGYEIPWKGDPALLASQLTEQEVLNEPSLEKASTEYSATLGTSTGDSHAPSPWSARLPLG
jgi:hypothetical protein